MIELAARLIRPKLAALRRKPLVRLFEHFFNRFFETGAVAGDPYARLEMGPVLGLVAVPGAIMSLILLLKYSPLARWFSRNFDFDHELAAIPDKYTFIVFSMAATGIVAVIKWESLFPDGRDFANLAPLPISTPVVFFAKQVALIAFAVVFAVDLNAVSAVLFPFISMENNGNLADIGRFVVAHVASVVLASMFVFCAFIALAGVLMNLLPYALFRRVTRYVQFGVIALLLMMFFLAPMTAPALPRIRTGLESFHVWLPPVWFVGLSETWHGRATPAFETLGAQALRSIGAAAVVAALTYAAAYRRYFLKTAEMPEIIGSRGRTPDWIWRMLDGTILRTPFDRGCFRFAVKTVVRSERHNSVLAAFLALAAALAVQACVLPAPDPAGFGVNQFTMAASLTILYFVITGLRLCFVISHEERANWVFQTAVADRSQNPRAVARKIIWIAVGVVLTLSLPVYAALGGVPFALAHTFFAALQSILLIELLLLDFHWIPFTCTYLPGKDNLVFAIAAFFTAYLVFAHAAAVIEYSIVTRPPLFAGYIAVVAGSLFGMRWIRESDRSIEFERPGGQLQLLRLFE